MAVRELVENSFPYGEPLLVREDGRAEVMAIGELVERELPSSHALELNGGSYGRLRKDLEVLTLDENLKLAFRRVTAVFRHPSPKELWKISLKAGRDVTTTSAHNVFVLDDGLQVRGKETSSLALQERVVVPAGEFMKGRMKEIDLLDELASLDEPFKERLVVRGVANLYPTESPKMEMLLLAIKGGVVTRQEVHATAQSLGLTNPDNLLHTLRRRGGLENCGRGEYMVTDPPTFKRRYTIPRDWVRCDAVPFSHLMSDPPPGLDTADVWFSVKQGHGALPRRVQLTKELMRILGYYTSEGSVHAGYKVSFSFGSHELHTHVADLIACLRSVFGVEPAVTIEHESAVNVVVNDSILGLFLEQVLRVGSDSITKRVPWVVFNVERDLAEEYLTAYIRGDGCVRRKKNSLRSTVATSSERLFVDLKFLLTLMDKQFSCHLTEEYDGSIKGVDTHFKPSYYIYIQKGRASDSDTVPLGRFRDRLQRLTGKTNCYRDSVSRGWTKKNFSPSRLPEDLRTYLSSDAGTLRVKGKKRVKPSGEWVYDISVEGVERFIGGGAVALLHNSLDSAEMAGTLPDIYVRIIPETIGSEVPDPRPYRLTVIDNGTGVAPQHVPSAFGKVFYGSKYVLRQSRGMFGLGGTMAILYGQITTNKPVVVTTSADGKWRHTFQMIIDIGENRPTVLKRQRTEANGTTGTRVDLILEGDYLRASQKINDYFKQTALVASYANLTFVDPPGQVAFYERATTAMPPAPKETLPHPYGIDVEALKRIIKISETHDMKTFMVTHFHRVGDKIAGRFLEFAGVSPRLPPKRLNNAQIVAIVDALQRFPDFLQPDAAVLSPIGEEILLAGIRKELEPEFSTVVARPPASYSGFPFLVEVGVAYGGKVLQPGVKLFRFANRIPLLYDESSDVSFEVLNEEVDWRRYHVPPEAPVGVITHIASTRIPYKTVGKEYIADRPEIQREIRNAVREALRRLGIFLSRKGSAEAVQKKMNIYGKYLPMIARFSTELAGKKDLPSYRRLIGEGGEILEEAPKEGQEPERPPEAEAGEENAQQEETGQETIDRYGGS